VPIRVSVRASTASSERPLDAIQGESLLDLLERHGHDVPTACGGNAACGLCRIEILAGGDRLTPMRDAEAWQLADDAEAFLRLACQARVCGGDDLTDPIVVRVCEPEPPGG
jgi:2Fe-2S ferredoxin